MISLAERREKIREKYRPIIVEKKLAEALKGLRQEVENQGKGTRLVLIGGIYRAPGLTDVKVLNYPPWEIGYKVEPVDITQGFFKRTIYIKLKGEEILEVPTREFEPIMGAVTQELLDIGNEIPTIGNIARDCIRITQQFAVVFWHEGNPNIVVPGGRK